MEEYFNSVIDIDVLMLNYATYFEQYCELNSNLIDIILSSTKGLFAHNQRDVLDWGFLNIGETLEPINDEQVLPSRVYGDCM